MEAIVILSIVGSMATCAITGWYCGLGTNKSPVASNEELAHWAVFPGFPLGLIIGVLECLQQWDWLFLLVVPISALATVFVAALGKALQAALSWVMSKNSMALASHSARKVISLVEHAVGSIPGDRFYFRPKTVFPTARVIKSPSQKN